MRKDGLSVADPGIGTRDGDVTDTNVSAQVHEPPFNPMISYPFPVEDGRRIGNVRVPKHLSQVDADRLADFVQTLVIW
jgi:hypothetical protein